MVKKITYIYISKITILFIKIASHSILICRVIRSAVVIQIDIQSPEYSNGQKDVGRSYKGETKYRSAAECVIWRHLLSPMPNTSERAYIMKITKAVLTRRRWGISTRLRTQTRRPTSRRRLQQAENTHCAGRKHSSRE